MPSAGPDYLGRNRAAWDNAASDHAAPGRRSWAGEPRWGVFGIPESEVGLLPEVAGKATLELGCGTAYVSSWLVRRGAHPVGVDLSPNQLATARRLQAEFELGFPLIRAAAESVPLRDASFDLIISEYGAAIWCDPYLWIPEAARLLRPGGELIFLGNAALYVLCVPEQDVEMLEARGVGELSERRTVEIGTLEIDPMSSEGVGQFESFRGVTAVCEAV